MHKAMGLSAKRRLHKWDSAKIISCAKVWKDYYSINVDNQDGNWRYSQVFKYL
jgi:hypothetical protein